MGAFNWSHALTIVGFFITITIAIATFRTFGRWHREKIEERRIDTAIRALALSYKSRLVFDSIRSPMSYEYEWQDMPAGAKEGAKSFFATLKRLDKQRDFFSNAWELQVECAAVFGQKVEDLFLELQKARREIEVAAEMLWHDPHPQNPTEENRRFWKKLEVAVWGAGYAQAFGLEDEVGKKLKTFQDGVEALCRPVLDGKYK